MKRSQNCFVKYFVLITLLLPFYASCLTAINSDDENKQSRPIIVPRTSVQSVQSSIAILKKTLLSFGRNYPVKPFCLDTYYKDFQEKDGKTYNLTEAAIKLCDKGFTNSSMRDEFTITHFRRNEMIKVVPFSPVPDRSLILNGVHFPDIIQNNLTPGDYGTELSILVASDPVRNYNIRTLPFIDTLSISFIRNHNFSAPVYTSAGESGIYVIAFNGKPSVTGDSLVINGKISVNSDNYALRSLEYSCYQTKKNNKSLKELFSFRADYASINPTDSLYYLNFLSLRNLCNVYEESDSLSLKIVDSGWNTFKNINPTLFIKFNNPLDQVSAMKRENYKASYMKDTIKINSVQAVGNTLYIRFKASDLKMPLDSCKVFADNLKDIYGNVFTKSKMTVVYQIRELRVIRVNGNSSKSDPEAQLKTNFP